MTNLSLRVVNEETVEFTKEQKIKLMQFAMVDEDYVERCNVVQGEMKNLDYE